MVIRAKFSSICPDCRNRIAVNDNILWAVGEKARHLACGMPKPVASNVFVCDACGSTRCSPGFCNTYDTVDAPVTRPAPTPEQIAKRLAHRPLLTADSGTDADDRSFEAWVAVRDTWVTLSEQERADYLARRNRGGHGGGLPSFQCEHNRSNHCDVNGNLLQPASLKARAVESWLASKRAAITTQQEGVA